MTTATITPEQRLTIVKHLAGGKGLDVVATMTHVDRSTVLDIGSKHGYPDTEKLAWAVDVLTKNLAEAAAPTAHPDPASFAAPSRPAAVASTPAAAGQPAPRPDELRALLRLAQEHPSKRVQLAADKAFDAIARVRTLLREYEEKHAAKRRQEAERSAAKAEVARLEAQLRAARAKLKSQAQRPGGLAAAASGQLASVRSGGLVTTAQLEDLGVSSKTVRQWAQAHDIECPGTGPLPSRVLLAYREAHQAAS